MKNAYNVVQTAKQALKTIPTLKLLHVNVLKHVVSALMHVKNAYKHVKRAAVRVKLKTQTALLHATTVFKPAETA